MKRLWIAVAIILLLVFGCVGAELSVEHGVDEIMSELELAHAYAGENRIPEAEEQAKKAEERWVEMEQRLSMFLQHSQLDQIGTHVARLSPALKYGDTAGFFADYEVCRVELLHIRDANSMNWKSLL